MKKKRCFYYCLSLLILALFNWRCVVLEPIAVDLQAEHALFSLQEAKDFFEEQTQKYPLETRKRAAQNPTHISAGNFVPKWECAVPSSKRDLFAYDIPIETDLRYTAIRSEYAKGKVLRKVVDVSQKLVIVKDANKGSLGQYILTLIPDKEYDVKYNKEVVNRFVSCAEKRGFSGLAIFTLPYTDEIIRVNRYVNGVKKLGVYTPDTKVPLEQRLMGLVSLLRGTVLKRSVVVPTRHVGEDD